MRNRAKCKKCGDVIESYHENDYVSCNCDEISIAGGTTSLKAAAKEWKNFLRVDDLGNEIIVEVKNIEKEEDSYTPSRPNKKELINMLDEMIKKIEDLPPLAMSTPINHYDMASFMLLISSILQTD